MDQRQRSEVGVSTFSAITIFALISQCCLGGSLTWSHDARLGYDTATASESPRWSRGALLVLERQLTAAPVITSFDQQGSLIASVAIVIPGAEAVSVYDYARGLDGGLVLCGRVFDREGRNGAFLGWVSPSGDTIRVVRTEPYSAQLVAPSPDGTVWTAGLEVVDGVELAEGRDRGVLRHFDKSGKFISSLVPRFTFASDLVITYGRLEARGDHIGWYTGMMPGPSEYIEVAQDRITLRFPGVSLNNDEEITGVAITDNLGTFVTTYSHNAQQSKLLLADKAHGAWLPMVLPADLRSHRWVRLSGSEGDTLVFRGDDRFVLKFYESR